MLSHYEVRPKATEVNGGKVNANARDKEVPKVRGNVNNNLSVFVCHNDVPVVEGAPVASGKRLRAGITQLFMLGSVGHGQIFTRRRSFGIVLWLRNTLSKEYLVTYVNI